MRLLRTVVGILGIIMNNIRARPPAQLPVSIAITSVLSFQATGIFGAEFDTPEADGFIADDVRRESVTPVSIHRMILAITAT
jgi:hypothetical protein